MTNISDPHKCTKCKELRYFCFIPKEEDLKRFVCMYCAPTENDYHPVGHTSSPILYTEDIDKFFADLKKWPEEKPE